MRATIEILYAAVAAGTMLVFEHPEEPSDPNIASALRLEEMQFAFQHLGVQMAHVHQCALGAASMKPTCLALVNAP